VLLGVPLVGSARPSQRLSCRSMKILGLVLPLFGLVGCRGGSEGPPRAEVQFQLVRALRPVNNDVDAATSRARFLVVGSNQLRESTASPLCPPGMEYFCEGEVILLPFPANPRPRRPLDLPVPQPLVTWVQAAGAIPANAISVQFSNVPHFICRMPYAGGLHLGKTYDVHCNIGYDGNGVVSAPWAFEVLTNPDHNPVNWVSPLGDNWNHAVLGGHEANGTPQYVCAVHDDDETNPGKTVSGRCNYEYAYRERSDDGYSLLAVYAPKPTVAAPPPKPFDHGHCGESGAPCKGKCGGTEQELCCPYHPTGPGPRSHGCGCGMISPNGLAINPGSLLCAP